eukprot:5360449-Lingulodinium_polyedra.AAC.1
MATAAPANEPEPSGHASDCKTFCNTKATIRADARQSGMPTCALTVARADMCLATALLKSET